MNGFIEQKTSFSSNYMTVLFENGDIYSADLMGNRNLVGVSLDKYKKLEETARIATETAEKHFNRLVELGDIVKPKTPEEQIAELCLQVSLLSNEIKALKEEKGNGLRSNTENTGRKPSNDKRTD